jgi:diaminopimelate epimerase
MAPQQLADILAVLQRVDSTIDRPKVVTIKELTSVTAAALDDHTSFMGIINRVVAVIEDHAARLEVLERGGGETAPPGQRAAGPNERGPQA